QIKRLFDIVGYDKGAVDGNAAFCSSGLASVGQKSSESAPWARPLPRRRNAAASLKLVRAAIVLPLDSASAASQRRGLIEAGRPGACRMMMVSSSAASQRRGLIEAGTGSYP